MKKVLSDIYNGFGSSFTNAPDGVSSKKIVAYGITFCVMMAHEKWWRSGDFSLLPTVLTLDFGFILTLMGINVYDKMKNQPDSTDKKGTDEIK